MTIRQLVFAIVLNMFVFYCTAQQNPDSVLSISTKVTEKYFGDIFFPPGLRVFPRRSLCYEDH